MSQAERTDDSDRYRRTTEGFARGTTASALSQLRAEIKHARIAKRKGRGSCEKQREALARRLEAGIKQVDARQPDGRKQRSEMSANSARGTAGSQR